jgi:hypothetical protein
MTHLELIAQLWQHRELLDRAYRQESVDTVPEALEESTLFLRTGSEYRLNQSYLTFVNAVLERVDYTVVFGDYEHEHKEIVRAKRRFEATGKEHYRRKILRLADDIYHKFFHRDRQIRAAVKELERSETAEIDLLIEEADDILERIEELVAANTRIAETFRELKSLEATIRTHLEGLDRGFYTFIENISHFIDRLERFIVQTRTKRRQNRLFMRLAADILAERDGELERMLLARRHGLLHTLPLTRRAPVRPLPDEGDLPALRKALKGLRLARPVRPKADGRLPRLRSEPLRLPDSVRIIADLNREGCDDLYDFLLSHEEVSDTREAFLVYLLLLAEPKANVQATFNRHNIRRVAWR